MRAMYDAADPANIPAWTEAVAGYTHGWPKWQDPWLLATHQPRRASRLILIDNTGTTPDRADILDVETGAATVSHIRTWVEARHHHSVWSWVYCSQSKLDACRQAAAGLNCHFWVANWDLDLAQATALIGGDIIGVQWASPSSNGLAGYDLSVIADSFFPPTDLARARMLLLDAARKVSPAAPALAAAAHNLSEASKLLGA